MGSAPLGELSWRGFSFLLASKSMERGWMGPPKAAPALGFPRALGLEAPLPKSPRPRWERQRGKEGAESSGATREGTSGKAQGGTIACRTNTPQAQSRAGAVGTLILDFFQIHESSSMWPGSTQSPLLPKRTSSDMMSGAGTCPELTPFASLALTHGWSPAFDHGKRHRVRSQSVFYKAPRALL